MKGVFSLNFCQAVVCLVEAVLVEKKLKLLSQLKAVLVEKKSTWGIQGCIREPFFIEKKKGKERKGHREGSEKVLECCEIY